MTETAKMLLMLFFAAALRGQCSLGCLACEKTSPVTFQCSVCDLHNNYALNENMKCVRSEIDGCEVPSADHRTSLCLRCQAGRVLDATQKKCVEVGEFHRVDNCEAYLSLNHCSACATDFYIKDGLCAALGDNKVQGCVAYAADLSACLACEPGKYLKAGACESITAVEHCSLYSQTVCDACKAGFLHERNYYSSAPMNAALAHEFVLRQATDVGRVLPPPASVCVEQNIPNCDTYVNFSFCGRCKNNYFLGPERSCEPNPGNVIPHCERYSDATTCAECVQSHFLSVNQCVERTLSDHCVKYEVTSSTCLECAWDHYLDASSVSPVCKPRVLSRHIEYCESRSVDVDKCGKCRENFLATDDKLGCRYHVPDCNTYESPTNFNTKALRCKVCSNGLYPGPDQTDCRPQDVINCHLYQPNSNVCVECNNGFFYSQTANTCEPYTALHCATMVEGEDKCATCQPNHYLADPSCLAYSIRNCKTPVADKDECEVCFENHFKKDGDCFAYNVVGCLEFAPDQNNCTKCNSGFYLENHVCVKINLLDCLTASPTANECVKCNSGFILTNGTCQKIYVPHCTEPSSTASMCNPDKCEDGFWRNNNGRCLKVVQPHCKTVDLNTGKCAQCEDGFYQTTPTDNLGNTSNNSPCLAQYRPFCKEYVDNTNKCKKCEEGYFLLSSACFEENLPGCKEFSTIQGPENKCIACREGFYLKNSLCLPYSINFCDVAETTKDECKTCFDGFLLHPVSKTCHMPDLPNCAEVDYTATPICKTCMKGFGINKEGQCEPLQLETNCLVAGEFRTGIDSDTLANATPSVTARPFFQCTVCAMGYFPDTDANGGCKSYDLVGTFCRQQKFNEEKCEFCIDGYKNTDGVCTKMDQDTTTSFVMCLYSNGLDDKCLACKPKSHLDSEKCTDDSGTGTMDDLCLANESGTDSTCTWCQDDHSLYTADATKQLKYVKGCVAWTPTPPPSSTPFVADCIQCAEGYQYDDTNKNCIKINDLSQALCIQKEETDNTALTLGTGCVKCPNYFDFFLDGDECKPRTKKYLDNCAEFSKSADLCTACKVGFESMTNNQQHGVCIYSNYKAGSTRKTKATVALDNNLVHCELYNVAQADGTMKCVVCKPNYELDASAVPKCVKVNADSSLIDNLFFDTQKFISKSLKNSPLSNASVLGRVNDDVNYVKCNDGYLASLEAIVVTTNAAILNKAITDFTFYDKLLDTTIHNGAKSAIKECIQISSLEIPLAKDGSLTASPNVEIDPKFENCVHGLKHEFGSNPDTTMYCLQCKENYNPIVVNYTEAASGTAVAISSLACWERTDIFERNYQFFPYNPALGFIDPLEMLNFDSCANGDILVASMVYESTNKTLYWKGNTATNMHPGLQCFASVSGTITLDGCQIYYVDPSVDPSTATAAQGGCVTCKPGYEATFDPTSMKITACTKIANCDFSDPSKNTWMNACETCVENGAWTLTDGEIFFNKCTIASDVTNPFENCYLQTGGKCVFCKKGFELSEKKSTCVPINEHKNGCLKYGHAINAFQTMNSATVKTTNYLTLSGTKKLIFTGFMNFLYKDNASTKVFGCRDCPADIIPIASITDETIDACLETPQTFMAPSSIVDNCAKLAFSTGTTNVCAKCVEGYTYDTNDSQCNLQTTKVTYANCAVHDGTLCTECEEGYLLFSGTCLKKNNCKTFSSGVVASPRTCSECEPGYMPEFGGAKDDCVRAPADDPCSRWTFEMGCIECYNGNVPITIEAGTANYYAKCTEAPWKKADKISQHDRLNHPWVLKFDTDKFIATQQWASIGTGEYFLKTVTDHPAQNCVPSFAIDHCEKLDRSNFCLKCEPGFLLKDPLTCIKGTIENCAEYQDIGKCGKCEAAFFLNSPTECKLRTEFGCLEYAPDADHCRVCHKGEYLSQPQSGTKPVCLVYTDANCAFFEPNSKFCAECLPGYILNASSECVVMDNQGCLLLLNHTGECARCLPGYYLDMDTGICKPYSFGGCKIHKMNKDECLQCLPQFFLKVTTGTSATPPPPKYTTCEERKKINCLVPNPNADECFSCPPGMYLNTKDCIRYTVQNCSLFHASEDQCVDCEAGFFLSADKKCEAGGDPNCAVLGKYNQRCLVCKNGTFYDSASKKCLQSTKSCAAFNPLADECLACEAGLWNDAGTCKRYTAINCLVHAVHADRCVSCVTEHYLAADGNCFLSSDPNCDIRKTHEDGCMRCFRGYYVDEASKCSPYTVSNCKFYNPLKNACIACHSGHYLDDQMDCQPVTQENCLGYVGNADKCANCQPGHYYSNGACKPYTVQNCVQTDAYADNCLKCEPIAFKYKNDCVAYTAEHCKTFDEHRDECTSCTDDRYLEEGGCHEYTVKHCKEYHPLADKCVACEMGYFRNGLGLCSEVTPVAHCATYHGYFDRCEGCDKGYYFDSGVCQPNPSGVFRCLVYATESICAACEPPYYLKDNTCLMSSTVIADCARYSFDANCAECEGNAFLESNQCVAVTNSTCLEYSSPENCSKCGPNRVLNTAGSTVVCEDSGIDHCLEAEYSTAPITSTDGNADPNNNNGSNSTPSSVTNICKKCEPGYFLKDNACTATTSVANCSEYASETLCSKCEAGHILARDQLSCAAIGDSAGANCEVARQTAEPECTVCAEGYFFDTTGKCSECKVTGCAVCDVINLRKCRLCKSGYQMTELFYCETVAEVESSQPQVNRLAASAEGGVSGANVLRAGVTAVALAVLSGLLWKGAD